VDLWESDAARAVAGRSDNVAALARSSLHLPTHFEVSEAYAGELAEAIGALIERHDASAAG